MILSKVLIKNFRSLQDVTIDFEPRGKTLVGINESGKSNVLKALSLLDTKNKPLPGDVREALPEEDPVEDSYVRFHFFLDSEEQETVLDNVLEQVLIDQKKKIKIKNPKGQVIDLTKFISQKSEYLYKIDVLTGDSGFRYWTLIGSYEPDTKLFITTDKCPADFTIETNDSTQKLSSYKLIDSEYISVIPEEYISEASVSNLYELITNEAIDLAKTKIPKTVFWIYDEKNLLPPSIDIAGFVANPESCVPLKNMFLLAGYTDIKNAIETARAKQTKNPFRNLLRNVATKTTKHFRSVWKEYKDIEFDLESDGNLIVAAIKEKNSYDLSQRSDGFKRFVSFLLLISVNVKTENLKNTLLLIDEPDMSLHPSGARYLRDELIRISKNNYLLFSTHSIFMVDSERIDRHLIVKKQNEITTVETASESNLVDEEVLFNSLGYSVFSILKEKNIIVEGWTDKNLLKVALSHVPTKYSKVKDLKDYGICYANGVKHIKNITPTIELAKRDCFVLSDADDVAKQHKKDFEDSKCYGTWITYEELYSKQKIVTAEDFVKDDIIVKMINDVVKNDKSIAKFDVSQFGNHSSGKLNVVEAWLGKEGCDKQKKKETIELFKSRLFENLKYSEIEDYYYESLVELVELINKKPVNT